MQGKWLSIIEFIWFMQFDRMFEHDDELVLKMTSRTCSTQLSASQYVEFLKLIDSPPLYIKTFREFKYTDVKEYQIAGIDFLLRHTIHGVINCPARLKCSMLESNDLVEEAAEYMASIKDKFSLLKQLKVCL